MDLFSSLYHNGIANGVSEYFRSKKFSMDLHISGKKISQLKYQSGRPSYDRCPQVERSSDVVSGVVVDNPTYILGKPKGNSEKEKEDAKKYFGATIQSLERLAKTGSMAGEKAKAVIAALAAPVLALEQLEEVPKADRQGNIRILVDGKCLAEYDGFFEWFEGECRKIAIQQGAVEGTCAITGKPDLIPTIIPSVKGRLPEKVKLISANKSAFVCFGKPGASSSSIGLRALNIGCAALDYLVSQSGLTMAMGNDFHVVYLPGKTDDLVNAIVAVLDGRIDKVNATPLASAPNWMSILRGAQKPYEAVQAISQMGGAQTILDISSKNLPICYMALKVPAKGQVALKRFETLNQDKAIQNVISWHDEQREIQAWYMREPRLMGVHQMVDALWPAKKDSTMSRRTTLFNEIMAVALKRQPPSDRLVAMAVNAVFSKFKSETTLRQLTPEMVMTMILLGRRSAEAKMLPLKRAGAGSDYEAHLAKLGKRPGRKEMETKPLLPKTLDENFDDIFYQAGRACALFQSLHRSIHPNVQAGIGPQMIKMLARNFKVGFIRLHERCATLQHIAEGKPKAALYAWLSKRIASCFKGQNPASGLPMSLSNDQKLLLMTGYHQEFGRPKKDKQEEGTAEVAAPTSEGSEALASIR